MEKAFEKNFEDENGKFKHKEWEEWCDSFKGVNFDSYPDFKKWQNARNAKQANDALEKVLEQAVAVADIKMARAVYRHAPTGSRSKKLAVDYTIKFARDTDDKWLERDAKQHDDSSLPADLVKEMNDSYYNLDTLSTGTTDDKNKIPVYVETPIVVGTVKVKLDKYVGLRNKIECGVPK